MPTGFLIIYNVLAANLIETNLEMSDKKAVLPHFMTSLLQPQSKYNSEI